MPRFTVQHVGPGPNDVRLLLDDVELHGVTSYTITHDVETHLPVVTLALIAIDGVDVALETERVLLAKGAQPADPLGLAHDRPAETATARVIARGALQSVSARVLRATTRADGDPMSDERVQSTAAHFAALAPRVRRTLLLTLGLATRDEVTEAELDPAHAGLRLDRDAWQRAARSGKTRQLVDMINTEHEWEMERGGLIVDEVRDRMRATILIEGDVAVEQTHDHTAHESDTR